MSDQAAPDERGLVAAEARAAQAAGEAQAALGGWRRLVRAEPAAARWRLRLADALDAADDPVGAAEVRADVLDAAQADGEPLAALVAALALETEGLAARFADYLAGSPRLAAGAPPRPPLPPTPTSVPDDDPAAALPPWTPTPPAALPPMPLLSLLDVSAFEALAPALERVSLAPGEVLLAEGAAGDSLYLVADGALEVVKDDPDRGDIVLGRVTAGGLVGEMALVLDRPRAATVRAADEVEAVRVPLDALRAVAAQQPRVADVLEGFTRQRLLATLVDTSPLFRDLSPGARAALLRGFEAREVPADAVLVEQGAPAGDLWLVVDGEVTVHRREGDDEAVQVATLGPGEVFGEIALLTGEPATATVRTTRDGRLDVLGADAFAAVRAAHPEVAERLKALGADRVAENRFIFEDDAFFEDAD
ncbi:MAG: cyclic nucleotide-binding domain-containing protein [Myxococcales bacterium]|nr:cyclic nucleotide-binding domain-containing protein [Myxococcales bacterium]